MGILWDGYQQYQIQKQISRDGELEQRVAGLEEELDNAYDALQMLFDRLETLEKSISTSYGQADTDGL
ncbi:hypothetical protein KC957_03770 [Candidatus Saccharibacteria bacterium]|nr:hypothetical protein [Candidatus Saccharibacteria bacterium]